MSTAVSTSTSDKGKGAGPVASGSTFQVHKPGEGYATRLALMCVVMSYTLFACWHWYYNWVFVRDFLGMDFLSGRNVSGYISGIGAGLIALVGFLLGYRFIYCHRPTSEFLIKTDVEMTKVTWPDITPWFKPESKVWGATYVVLIVVVALTAYVFGVDFILERITRFIFYGG